MKYIRRKILHEIGTDSLKQKAVAFALLIKHRTNNSSVIRNATVSKIQDATSYEVNGKIHKMHVATIRKYIKVLSEMGLATYKDGDLFIQRMSSSIKHRNVDLSCFVVDNTKDIYHQIRDVLFLLIQAKKDFVQSLLRLRANPTDNVDFKKVKRFCKRCLNNPYAKPRENGLSYKKIASKLGCCTRTAFKVVKDAIKRKWVKKENNCEIHFLRNVNFMPVQGYTFTTKNFGFILRASTYTLNRNWKDKLFVNAEKNHHVHPKEVRYGHI